MYDACLMKPKKSSRGVYTHQDPDGQSTSHRNTAAPPHLDPLHAHKTLKENLDGLGEEEHDGSGCVTVQRHSNEDAAGCDGVAQLHVDGEGHEDDDLDGRERGCQV